MRSWIGIKFANFGKNIQILFEYREKLENICSIYMWGENGVKLCTGVLHNLTKYINYYVSFNMSQIRLLGQNIKILCKNCKKGKHCRFHICSCISFTNWNKTTCSLCNSHPECELRCCIHMQFGILLSKAVVREISEFQLTILNSNITLV